MGYKVYNMTVTVTINPKFKHLTADRSYVSKPGGVGIEKEMVVDITITTEDLSDATAGQFVADFTQVGLKQVYLCQVVESDDLTDGYQFIEAALSDAATAKIAVYELATGAANASASYTATLKAIVRGV